MWQETRFLTACLSLASWLFTIINTHSLGHVGKFRVDLGRRSLRMVSVVLSLLPGSAVLGRCPSNCPLEGRGGVEGTLSQSIVQQNNQCRRTTRRCEYFTRDSTNAVALGVDNHGKRVATTQESIGWQHASRQRANL